MEDYSNKIKKKKKKKTTQTWKLLIFGPYCTYPSKFSPISVYPAFEFISTNQFYVPTSPLNNCCTLPSQNLFILFLSLPNSCSFRFYFIFKFFYYLSYIYIHLFLCLPYRFHIWFYFSSFVSVLLHSYSIKLSFLYLSRASKVCSSIIPHSSSFYRISQKCLEPL